jgi:hypothetical protein
MRVMAANESDRRCGDDRRNSVDKPQAVAMRVRRRNDGLGAAPLPGGG